MKHKGRIEGGFRTIKESVLRLADTIGYRMSNDQATLWQERLIQAGIDELTADDICDRMAIELEAMPKLPELISRCKELQYQRRPKARETVQGFGVDPQAITEMYQKAEKFLELSACERSKIKQEFERNFPHVYDAGKSLFKEFNAGDYFLYRWHFERKDYLKSLSECENEQGKQRLRELV